MKVVDRQQQQHQEQLEVFRDQPTLGNNESTASRKSGSSGNSNGGGGVRKCWATARERQRMKARYAIQQRIFGTCTDVIDTTTTDSAAAAAAAATVSATRKKRVDSGHDDNINTALKVSPTAATSDVFVVKDDANNTNNNSQSISLTTANCADNNTSKIRIQTVLEQIIHGNTSYFSLQFMEENYTLLYEPFTSTFLFETIMNHCKSSSNISSSSSRCNYEDIEEKQSVHQLFDVIRLRSRMGRTSVDQFHAYASSINTFTILEYAVVLKRYRIIRQLIIGGIVNPIDQTSSSSSSSSSSSDEQQQVSSTRQDDVRVSRIRKQVQQLFLSGRIPLSLSCYMVYRLIGLRPSTWQYVSQEHQEPQQQHQLIENDAVQTTATIATTPPSTRTLFEHTTPSKRCMICNKDSLNNLILVFSSPILNQRKQQKDNGGNRYEYCSVNGSTGLHQFCEVCLWTHMIQSLYTRSENEDVVQCPICDASKDNPKITNPNTAKTYPNESRQMLYRCSLDKYQLLPLDAPTMKCLQKKKKTPPEQDAICNTWSDAVKPFIGCTQESRRDKFLQFIEKGSIHHVKACIEYGIDMNIQNEYGQTAYFLAVWKNNFPLVQLLVQNGCDITIPANGQISPYFVAKVNKYVEIIDAIDGESDHNICYTDNVIAPFLNNLSNTVIQLSQTKCNILIHSTEQHPGAGSFIAEDFLEPLFVDALFDLWSVLPIEVNAKKKIGPCSERRYYCDALGVITKMLTNVVQHAIQYLNLPFTSVICGSHMRFLNYMESGAILAPHIDLSREDPNTTQRSTHSFLLYLTTCTKGGETALLADVTGDGRNIILASVQPKRGLILIFPHKCPHEGLEVVDAPKMLIRGELWMS